MKKYTLPIRQSDQGIYDLIKSGKKKVETRAAGPKYKDIQDGDIVIFKCGKASFERVVKKVKKFSSIDSMLQHYKVQDINPHVKTVEELKKMYYSFPGYKNRLEKFGIIAFELSK